jgi:hypothetical protein
MASIRCCHRPRPCHPWIRAVASRNPADCGRALPSLRCSSDRPPTADRPPADANGRCHIVSLLLSGDDARLRLRQTLLIGCRSGAPLPRSPCGSPAKGKTLIRRSGGCIEDACRRHAPLGRRHASIAKRLRRGWEDVSASGVRLGSLRGRAGGHRMTSKQASVPPARAA